MTAFRGALPLPAARLLSLVFGVSESCSPGSGNRRLDNAEDFVRIEVQMALELGKAVIPVVVTNASHPKAEDLPDALQRLAVLNGISVRPDPDFHRDMDRLITRLRELFGESSEGASDEDLRLSKVTRLEQTLRGVADMSMPRISEHPYAAKMKREPHETLTEWYLATQEKFARLSPLFEANLFLLNPEVRGELENVSNRIGAMKRRCRPVATGSDDVGNPEIELATLQVMFRKLVYEAMRWELKKLHG